MALDTRNKRSSAIHVSLPWRGLLPAPDGAVNQADRQHVGLMYAGILATAPAVTALTSPIALLSFADVSVATLSFVDTPVAVLPFVDVPVADMEIDYG